MIKACRWDFKVFNIFYCFPDTPQNNPIYLTAFLTCWSFHYGSQTHIIIPEEYWAAAVLMQSWGTIEKATGVCVCVLPVTWWLRVFLLFLSRWEPSPTSLLLTQLFDYLRKRKQMNRRLKCERTGRRLMMYAALTNHDTYPLTTRDAARAHLWVGWACQLFGSCIPVPCSSSCTPGCPLWGVHQTMLWFLLSWYNLPNGQDCKKRKSGSQVLLHFVD